MTLDDNSKKRDRETIKIQTSLLRWLTGNRERFDAVVLDVDGVLLLAGKALPGSRELLDLLGHSGLTFRLLTNAADFSVDERIATLRSRGLLVEPGQMTSSGHPLNALASERNFIGRPFFLAGRLGRPCHAEGAGFRVVRDLASLPACEGVIIGEDGYDWEPVINGIIGFFITHPQAPLIVPNPDLYYPAGSNSIRIASGGISHLITHILEAYGIRPETLFLGKPYDPLFTLNHALLEGEAGRDLARERVLMVGDSLPSDIAGGRAFGYTTALLLTGNTTEDQLAGVAVRPDLVFRRL